MITKRSVTNAAIVAAAFAFPVFGVYGATNADQEPNGCANLPSYSQLKSALTAATVTETSGFVLIARQEGAESVNCGASVPDNPAFHDIHISIVDAATNTNECSGVVVEMVPHHRPASWTQENVQAVANKHLPVRVTGQLMFDSSHTPCVGGAAVQGDPKRASLWEVHPIYKFEVCPGGSCVSLEEWAAAGAK
jgi:hypothetical protein